MANHELLNLRSIVERRDADVDGLLAGIRGVEGQGPWTATFQAVVRKDDPPEED